VKQRVKSHETYLLGHNAMQSTDISGEHDASISRALLAICSILVPCLAYCSTLKMEAPCCSKHELTFTRLHPRIQNSS
jgi:hypothetical protein